MDLMVVTANRLVDGAVVYMTSDGGWSACLDGALVAAKADSRTMLEKAERAVAGRLVVGPYAIEVESGGDGLRPRHIREVIRAAGPTVGTDTGTLADHPARSG